MPTGLTTRDGPTRRELLVFVAVLGVATFLLLFEHVVKAGFYSDDWAYQANWVHYSHGSFWTGLSSFFQGPNLRGRPTLALYLSVVEQVLGTHQQLYLAWAAVLAVAFSTSLYVLLRALRLRPLDAGLIGLLVLVFPASDSTRIWSIISDAQAAMSLVTLGVTCSIVSLSSTGRRSAALRVGGLVLVVLGVTTYELTFGALLLAFLLYRSRAPWRRVLREAVIDWIVLILVYVLLTSHTIAQRLTTSQTISHGWTVAKQTVTLLARTAMPFGSTAAGIVAAVLIVLTAVGVRRRLPAGDPTRVDLDRWLRVLGVAILMLAGAYVIYAPSSPFYEPLATGELNRTNAFGAVPMIVVVYALAALLGLLIFHGLRHARDWSAAATAVIAIAIGIGYTISISRDLKLWDSGYHRAQLSFAAFRSVAARPPPHSLIVFFGQPIQESPNIPVWGHAWDLSGALALAYNEPLLNGTAAFQGTVIVCGRHGAGVTDPSFAGVYLPTDHAAYGSVFLFNTITGALGRPTSQRQCQSEAPTFVPGPFLATDPGADDPGL